MIILLWHFKEMNSTLIVQLLWGWKGSSFKIPLCKIAEIMIAYDEMTSNTTLYPRTSYALYIGPNDSGTSYSVLKLSKKQLLITPKCKPVPMTERVFQHMFDMKYKNQHG